jgi:hypothetical protein
VLSCCSWALEQLQKHSSAAAWSALRAIGTDGEPSFPVVFEQLLPNVFHWRCIWHIYQNLGTNLSGALGQNFQPFLGAFKAVFGLRRVEEFEPAWAQLLAAFPQSARYLTANTYPTRQQWCTAWTLQYPTLGRTSTQLGEAMNSVSRLTASFIHSWSAAPVLPCSCKHFRPCYAQALKSTIGVAGGPFTLLIESLDQMTVLQDERRTQRRSKKGKKAGGDAYRRQALPYVSGYAADWYAGEVCRADNYAVVPAAAPAAAPEAAPVAVAAAAAAAAPVAAAAAAAPVAAPAAVPKYDVQHKTQPASRHQVCLQPLFCTCHDPTNLGMACRHVIAVNRYMDLPLFQPLQFLPRWRVEQIGPAMPSSASSSSSTSSSSTLPDIVQIQQPTTKQARFASLTALFKSIASTACMRLLLHPSRVMCVCVCLPCACVLLPCACVCPVLASAVLIGSVHFPARVCPVQARTGNCPSSSGSFCRTSRPRCWRAVRRPL